MVGLIFPASPQEMQSCVYACWSVAILRNSASSARHWFQLLLRDSAFVLICETLRETVLRELFLPL